MIYSHYPIKTHAVSRIGCFSLISKERSSMSSQDEVAMSGLVGKIYKSITSPNSVVSNAVPRNSVVSTEPPYISFCSPGIALDSLNFGNLLTPDEVNNCSDFSQLINSIPTPGALWAPTSSKVWEIYNLAITDIKLPVSDLSQQEKDTLERAESFLREEVATTDPFTLETKDEVRPTAAYQAYENLFTAYASTVKAYNNARITAISDPTPENVANWVNNGPILEQEVRNAYSRWGSLGYRDYVTRANGIISALMARGPFAYYEKLRANFVGAEKKDFRGNSFYPTFAYPARIMEPAFSQGWGNFTFTEAEIHQYSSSTSVSYGGGGGASFGLWSFGGSAQYSSTSTYASCDMSNMSVSVDLVQVPLLRPWMTSWIFSSRGWQGGTMIGGDGSISSGSTPLTGKMPLIPTSMILARNLRINLDMSSEVNRTFSSSVSTSASVGWGPFSVRGNYSRTTNTASHDYTSTGSGIICPGTQIIGLVCEVLPRCPNHDPALTWEENRPLHGNMIATNDDNDWLLAAPFLGR